MMKEMMRAARIRQQRTSPRSTRNAPAPPAGQRPCHEQRLFGPANQPISPDAKDAWIALTDDLAVHDD
jgi:hypothetical protein